MDGQDWEPITVGSAKRAAAPKPAHAPGAKLLHALEDDDAPKKPTRSLSKESRESIIALRNARTPKLSQVELNTLCSFPANTIRDIEAGRLCPSPKQLDVLNRVLRTTLKYA
jgi:hypothetical protein